jgi:DNA-binding beta-propeller fold protein YncE
MILSSDRSKLFVADSDNGAISQIDPEAGTVDALAVGLVPTRLARIDDDRIVVTLRGERAIAILNEDGDGALSLDRKISVGAEPYGVVTHPDGDHLYVVSSLSGRVDELETDAFTFTRGWSVLGEPRWLAIHPSGESLYVASAFRGTMTRIDLEKGVAEPLALPPLSFDTNRATRLTGDPSVSPNGALLVVPMLSVDHQTPIEEVDPPEGMLPPPSSTGYGSMVPGAPKRFEPSIGVVDLDDSGRPVEGKAGLAISARGSDASAVGYVASVNVSPSGAMIFATIEGADVVLAVPFEVPSSPSSVVFEGGDNSGGFGPVTVFRPNVLVRAPAGPRSVAFGDDDQAFIFGGIDRGISVVDAVETEHVVTNIGARLESKLLKGLPPSTLSARAQRGRRFFFTTNDSAMSTPGSSVSCATCHFEGRNDGLTWNFTRGGRQTPSLAGKISLTAPVRWEGDRATVAEDALMTITGLMGGSAGNDIAQDIEVFIDQSREVDVPHKGSTDPEVLRGKAIFERPDVACGTCHNGPRLTDNQLYPMFGMAQVKTRSLVGVAASAPYLHDGSAPTLRAVLEQSRYGVMGNTGALSEDEMRALERYLESL